MRRMKYSGRQLITIGAITLLVWAGYECYIRLTDLVWWFDGTVRLCANEHIPFTRAIAYYNPSMFYLTAYLLIVSLFSVATLIMRNRPMGNVFTALAVAAFVALGNSWVGLLSLDISNWAQSLKLIPFLLIAVGCVVNIAQFGVRKSKRGDGKEAGNPDGDDSRDYTSMNGKDLAHEVKQTRARHHRRSA